MLLAAILGAPCAGLLVFNPLLVGAGLSVAGLGTAAAFFDQSLVRVPLLTLATVAALANLVAIVWTRQRAEAASPETTFTAARQWGRPLQTPGLGVAISVVALTVVAFEFVAHAMMH